MGKEKFKAPKADFKGNKFELKPNQVIVTKLDYPVFCFKHMHPDYSIDKVTDDKEKAAFLDALFKRSQLKWTDFSLLNRHKLGSEKIPVKSIKAKLPTSVTEDVTDLLAFRYFEMKPFLGYQNSFIFHVLYIDYKRDLYDHG